MSFPASRITFTGNYCPVSVVQLNPMSLHPTVYRYKIQILATKVECVDKNKVTTVVETRGKSGKIKKVEMVREKSGKLGKKEESQEKSRNSDRFSTPQVQFDSSFCQNALSRSHEKLSEVREKSHKSQGN